jgi:hypothetical protein
MAARPSQQTSGKKSPDPNKRDPGAFINFFHGEVNPNFEDKLIPESKHMNEARDPYFVELVKLFSHQKQVTLEIMSIFSKIKRRA